MNFFEFEGTVVNIHQLKYVAIHTRMPDVGETHRYQIQFHFGRGDYSDDLYFRWATAVERNDAWTRLKALLECTPPSSTIS